MLGLMKEKKERKKPNKKGKRTEFATFQMEMFIEMIIKQEIHVI